jgi:FAD/FMN-containing dehydrogenase
LTADLGRRRALRLLGGAAALPFIAPCMARGGGQADGTGAPAVRPSGHPISSVVRCPVSKVGDARFDGFTASWNGCVRASPAAVVHARTAEDVASTVRWIRAEGVPLAVRSGGHSFVGDSTGDGVVLDLSGIDGIEPGDAGGTVQVGGGVRNGPLGAALYHRLGRRTMTLGSCPSVGMSGLMLGGGFNAMSRVHGLAIDALTEVEVVLADGSIVLASPRERPELFWALRGGGGGFGIVTRMTFRHRPWMPVHSATVRWAFGAGAAVLAEWSRWIESLPEGSSSSLVWMTSGSRENSQVRVIVHSERNENSRDALVRSLRKAVSAAPSSERSSSSAPPAAQPKLRASGPRSANASAFADGEARSEAIEALASAFGQRVRPGGCAGTAMLICNALGGAVADVASDATAFAHRGARFIAEVAAEWEPDRADLDAPNRAWVRATIDAARPGLGAGAYVNYADAGLQHWRRAYWGANLERLEAVKRSVDPGRVFAGKQRV